MRPSLSLDSEIVAANARAWSAFAGVPVRAVVKCDGYGWGQEIVVRALDGIVESYCVADADELHALREFTAAPAIVLGAVPSERLREVLAANGQPSISNRAELDVAAEWSRAESRPLRVRVGIRTAAAWNGLLLEELAQFAPQLAAAAAEIELWTHLTDLSVADEQLALFDSALEILQRSGVTVSGSDLCSTLPAGSSIKRGTSVRIGAGLFGATGGAAIPGVRCAISMRAPVLRIERHSAGTRLGYGGTMLGMDSTVATLRSGFGDGLPSSLQATGDVLMVGMQYAAVLAGSLTGSDREFAWLDPSSDLDAFARSAGRPVHEIITTLGNCARAGCVEKRFDAGT
ncbi:MAG TPA: alanine racemase [Candidatus Rubrimentiphilum sp.]|nr:alanine racemase [Candidatus Rubrimentiphilum sp.]